MASTSTMEMEDPNLDENAKEIEKIIKIIYIIINSLGSENSTRITTDISNKIIDIDLSNEIADILIKVFNCLQKEPNKNAEHLKYKEYTAKIMDVEIDVHTIVDAVKAANIEINLRNILKYTLFKHFFNEIRTGLTRFKIKSLVAGRHKINIHSISQYGLTNVHMPLLHGITFPPKIRMEVIKSLGPLTQAILLVNEDSKELSSALIDSLQILPMAQDIVKCLKQPDCPRIVASVLNELGNILLLTSYRTMHKVNFPLLLIVFMWQHKPDGFNWSFSEPEVLKCYIRLVNEGVLFRIRSGGDEVKTSEAVFHTMFGTYLHDLDGLSSITTHNDKWTKRKDMNSVFLNRREKNPIIIKPISFKYISKMNRSCPPHILLWSEGTSRPAFEGFRIRYINRFTARGLQNLRALNFSRDPNQLAGALRKTKEILLEEKYLGNMSHPDENVWKEFVDGAWQESNFIPVEGSYKFFGF